MFQISSKCAICSTLADLGSFSRFSSIFKEYVFFFNAQNIFTFGILFFALSNCT